MNYKSYRDLSLTINRNLHKIPRDIDLVVGVPRSGMLPATMIGLIFNKPVVALDSYLDGKIYEMGLYRRPKTSITNFSEIKKVLIMDDSINSGHSINTVKEKISKSDRHVINTIYGAVYYVRESLHHIDFGLEECAWPRIFQWNILNSWVLANACLDIDGVVCTDPTEEQNDDGDQYKDFLKKAKPLFLTEFPIGCFVTSRLEKYRALTEEWLRTNHLHFAELIMLDLPTKEERLRQNKHAPFKADVYKNRKEELFIESNLSQAVQISQLTGKLVFCTENMEMIHADMSKSDPQRNIKKYLSEQNIDIPRSTQSGIHIPERSSTQTDHGSLPDRSEPHVKLPVQRILFVNHNIAPYELTGTPLSTLNHARGMKARGLEVSVLIPDRSVRNGVTKNLLNDIPLYKMPKLEQEETFFSSVSAEALRQYQQIIHFVLQDFRPDIVHINDYVFMPSAMIHFFSQAGIPVVRNICNTEEICYRIEPVLYSGRNVNLCQGPEDMERCAQCYCRSKNIDLADAAGSIKKRFIQKFQLVQDMYNSEVSAVIFTTPEFRKYFTSFIPIREEETRIIPRGFDFEHERPSISVKMKGSVVKFGFIGLGIPRKGIDVILRAVEKLPHKQNFELHFYGDIGHEPFADWIDELNKKHGNTIHCHGAFAPEDLPKIASEIHCAIIPSYFETYNRVVREMLWSGVPVIATDFFGSSIIQEGINGHRIASGDSNALADRMSRLIEDPHRNESLSFGALQTPIPSLDDEIEGLLKVYRDLSATPQSRSLENRLQQDEIFGKGIDRLSYLDTTEPFHFSTLYVDTGDGFNEEQSLKRSLPGHFGNDPVSLEFNVRGFTNIRALRFDPIENAPASIDVVSVILKGRTGAGVAIPIGGSNALYACGSRFVFSTHDPAVYLSMPEGTDDVETIQLVLKYSVGQEYVGMLERVVDALSKRSPLSPLHAKLYIDTGHGYTENNSLIATLPLESGSDVATLTFPLSGIDPIKALRLDPIENAVAIVEVNKIELRAGSLVESVRVKTSNAAYVKNNRYAFMIDDPAFHLEMPGGMKRADSLVLELKYLVKDAYVNAIGDIIAEAVTANFMKYVSGQPHRAKLYVDSGSGFIEENALAIELPSDPRTGRIVLDIDLKPYGKIKALRWHPIEHAAPIVELTQLQVYRKSIPVRTSVTGTNAASVCDNILIFATDDPNLEISLPTDVPSVDRLHIQYRVMVRKG
jgi:glycosyltransferase involved in cell wall biosynthesis/uncharacterized HAD superfamily protein/hypoxanthine phosphoribosyltransferase